MHYVLGCAAGKAIIEGPDVDESWWTGHPLEDPPVTPLIVTLDPESPAAPASIYSGLIPIWSAGVVAAVRAAGVDNIDVYPAVVRDPRSGREWSYSAVNVLGIVSAIDLDGSGIKAPPDERGDIFLDQVVLDDASAAPFALFRLAESLDVVLVDERVRRCLERSELPDIRFTMPGAAKNGPGVTSPPGVHRTNSGDR